MAFPRRHFEQRRHQYTIAEYVTPYTRKLPGKAAVAAPPFRPFISFRQNVHLPQYKLINSAGQGTTIKNETTTVQRLASLRITNRSEPRPFWT